MYIFAGSSADGFIYSVWVNDEIFTATKNMIVMFVYNIHIFCYLHDISVAVMQAWQIICYYTNCNFMASYSGGYLVQGNINTRNCVRNST